MTESVSDPYAVLGIPRDASRQTALEAYRRLAKQLLAQSVEMERDALRDYVQAGEPQEEEGEPTTPPTPAAESSGIIPPSILWTTLKGAKGLSAEHVFVVGLMNGHFPDRGTAPSDEEICELLVELSRTRKQCHLVSTPIFAGPPPLRPSVFLSWWRGRPVRSRWTRTIGSRELTPHGTRVT
jgi:superfamily I DNA/RNA helicase